jgi:nucleotide-binding universal stress UspA family protein
MVEVTDLISKVLVATDGSECADKALVFALDLADKFSASVLIVNVLELPVFNAPEEPLATSTSMMGVVKDLQKAHMEVLAKAEGKAKQLKPNLQVSTELREGNPAAQIVAAATEGSFDVIALGHGGAGRFRELFLGGTSERVAHVARCAVLIVK